MSYKLNAAIVLNIQFPAKVAVVEACHIRVIFSISAKVETIAFSSLNNVILIYDSPLQATEFGRQCE